MPDGRLVAAVAGYADYSIAITPPRLVRFNSDGSLDPAFNVTFESPGFLWNSTVYALALQPDGKILVSGTFLRVNGVSRGKMARLGSDGALDFCFDVAMGGEWSPLAVAPMPDGSVVVGGSFSGLQGQSHPYLLRLLPPAGCARALWRWLCSRCSSERMRCAPLFRWCGTAGRTWNKPLPLLRATARRRPARITRRSAARCGSPAVNAVSSSPFRLYSDDVTEGPETFEVQLTQANDGAALGVSDERGGHPHRRSGGDGWCTGHELRGAAGRPGADAAPAGRWRGCDRGHFHQRQRAVLPEPGRPCARMARSKRLPALATPGRPS